MIEGGNAVDLAALVRAAAAGDSRAWDRIVDDYASLVWSVGRSFRLGDADLADVSQTVWLRLVERLGTLRDRAALPGWLYSTTRRECLAVLGRSRRELLSDEPVGPGTNDGVAIDDELLEQERAAALWLAFAELPAPCRDLLALLVTDPPTPYEEISVILGYPKGAIGPKRSRCLDRLRRSPALAQL